MEPFQYNPGSVSSTPTPHNNTPRPQHHRHATSQIAGQTLQERSEHKSETSSNSGSSFRSRNMNRGRGSYQRGGRGGSRGGRGGNRAHSNSSGSSNGQDRPALRPSSAPQADQGRIATPEQPNRDAPAQIDSPVTPVKQQSSFTLNGCNITETYTARTSTITSPPRQVTQASPRNGSQDSPQNGLNQPRYSQGSQRPLPRPIMRDGAQHWAYHQEAKIRVLGLPKGYWTKEVYQALSLYGRVVRVEMVTGTHSNNAYVVFQPPPPSDVPHQNVAVGTARVRTEPLPPFVTTIPRPVNPAKTYYEFNIIPANAIDFGIRIADKSMIAMRTVKSKEGIQMMLNLNRKELDIQFPLNIDREMRKFRFRLPISFLSHIYKVSDKATGHPTLIIPFDSPPQFFIQKKEDEELSDGRRHTSFSRKEKSWIDWSTWFRETDVISGMMRTGLAQAPLMNHKDTAIIDIGRWSDYRLTFDNATLDGPKFKDFSSALADYGVAIEDLDQYIIKKRIASPLWSLLQEEISGTHPHLEPVSNESIFDDLFASQIHLSFPVRYQLEACLSNGYLKEHNITNAFLEKVGSMDPRQVTRILEKIADKQHTYYDPMEIFGIRVKSLEKKVPSYCILQRSVIITPTMMHVASPAMETSNRIIRKYEADADRFIRVKFSDEKTEGQLRNMPNDRAEAVFDRVRRAMKNGIVVAGRYYEFLAFGNSQFREHGAYFYAPTSSKSADDIRLSLGQFSHIKTVAKFGARLGQCFSTTRAMRVTVKIRNISDIERNGYNFSDGVGKLSLFLAQMAAQELGLSNAFDDPPSLFQFRLGGCKGVLALDLKITGNEVFIRPSQQKFEAEFMGLEIIRSSALATPFFNRQVIIVLSNLGVRDHVFIRKQQAMVNDYETAMIDEDVAVQKLRKHIDMNQTTLTMAGMVLDGFMRARDPFIMSLLKLWRACTIKNLKEKARIAIEDGAFVLGCVDETATLKGHMDDPQSRLDATREEKLATLPEIFLQVDDTSKKGHYKIIEGVCILARNPSLHPGDLRVVRAVNVPTLRHLKNVVVLPQTGDRDLANMCSGGDLDGDDYMVLWDSDLIPEIINVPPMDFTPEKPLETDEPITAAHIGKFFVTYMKNDSLGQIAHAHLAQADIKAAGVNDDTCLELAKLHSKAVDFPKSGEPAVMDRELRPKKWPHFMEKKHMPDNKKYKSEKILGVLYDQVQLVGFKPEWENKFDKRVLDAFQLDDTILTKAADIKVSYDESLRRLMAKHGIRSEFEAWSVFVLAHNNESRDYKFAEEFGRTIAALKSQFREASRVAADVSGVADWDHLGPFVAAMYSVTAREVEMALEECRTMKTVGGQEVPIRAMNPEHMPLISFPWLFPSELGKMATAKKKA
ncbi:RdRP-domain-containing protein [Clathrospora elynae]|uniref:RNA-dependent RNA polymerase n=1 Tax=Clathrospora elynae TaxID=706981 RepID=A0A6A5T988_9PLEO|nr:RdRP-domain-containing protein [Clathrospora elynae]